MQLLNRNTDGIVLRLSHEEGAVLCNALNEALESLADGEFEIRMGASKAEVTRILAALGQIDIA